MELQITNFKRNEAFGFSGVGIGTPHCKVSDNLWALKSKPGITSQLYLGFEHAGIFILFNI